MQQLTLFLSSSKDEGDGHDQYDQKSQHDDAIGRPDHGLILGEGGGGDLRVQRRDGRSVECRDDERSRDDDQEQDGRAQNS